MRRHQVKMEKISTAFMLERKWLSLSSFVLQNSLLILGLKACTISSSHSMNQYIASTAVIFSEVLKFMLSAAACFIFDANCNVAMFRVLIYNMVMEEGADSLKLCVPALLYTIQNNLQYIIEEAPLFLVLYQAKIITTAIFYSTLLSRRLSTKEWACIIALAMGVSMVESSQIEVVPNHASNITGVVAVVFACLTSGVAGVSFEKILKSSRSSIWMINMQLSLLSAFFCTVSWPSIVTCSSFTDSLNACTVLQSVALTQDSVEIAHHGVFTGYNPLVLLSIVLQAVTGLVSVISLSLHLSTRTLTAELSRTFPLCRQAVALVVKYADNIYKGFGHSISLVFCSSLSSVVFEDTVVNETFILGSFLVLAASAFYASITASQLTPVTPMASSTSSASSGGGGGSGAFTVVPIPKVPSSAGVNYSALRAAEEGTSRTAGRVIDSNSDSPINGSIGFGDRGSENTSGAIEMVHPERDAPLSPDPTACDSPLPAPGAVADGAGVNGSVRDSVSSGGFASSGGISATGGAAWLGGWWANGRQAVGVSGRWSIFGGGSSRDRDS